MKKSTHKTVRLVRYILYKETIIKPIDLLWSFIGSFLGIAAISTLNWFFTSKDAVMLIGSFGASAVLLYGAANSPLAQPRNLLLGHFLSALIGVAFYKLLPEMTWLSGALSVASSIVLMQITKSMHPPGGATALIANIGSEKIKALGFFYALYPVLIGATMLFVVAVLINNIPKNRNYPYRKR